MVLTDGWITHTHYLAALGFALLIFSMWRMTMKTPEDEAFEEIERAQAHDKKYIKHQLFPAPPERNEVLEEVAKEFDKMRSLGDTAASFAAFVRGMKR